MLHVVASKLLTPRMLVLDVLKRYYGSQPSCGVATMTMNDLHINTRGEQAALLQFCKTMQQTQAFARGVVCVLCWWGGCGEWGCIRKKRQGCSQSRRGDGQEEGGIAARLRWTIVIESTYLST